MSQSANHPNFVVVPASPQSLPPSSTPPNPSPSLSRSTSDSASTQQSSLAFESRRSDSSERTTICSLYTMYADDPPKPPSSLKNDLPIVTKATALSVDGRRRPRSFNLPAPEHAGPLARSSTGNKYDSYNLTVAPVTTTPSTTPPPRSSSLLRPLPTLSPNVPPESIPLPPSLSPSRTPSPAPSPLQLSAKSVSSIASTLPQQAPDEQADAHHVRSTYALMEQVGVPQDGFSEGVERTRARLGATRASQLLAEGSGLATAAADKSRDLNPDELRVLNTVDRYGFFNPDMQTNHERMILLPTDALGTRGLKAMKDVTKAAKPSPPPLSQQPPAHPTLKEGSRTEKWNRMLMPIRRDPGGNVHTWGVKSGKEKKVRRRLYKGIPDRWRGAVWSLLIDNAAAYGKGKERPAELTVDQVDVDLTDVDRLEQDYHEAITLPSSYDVQIDLDVPRTIGGHIMFKTRYGAGQRSLFYVLHAFSLRCNTCGYVQGMGPITSTLLLYLPPSKVYSLLCILHSSPRFSLHTLFSPGFPGLLENIYVQERLIEHYLPSVHRAFKTIGVSTTSFATKWYITMFANSVPFQTQLRLWDVWFLEGQDTWVVLAVGIVYAYRKYIQSPSANFETVLSLLSAFFVAEDENALLSWMADTLGNMKLRAQMHQWRTDWKGMVERGEDADALL